MFPIQWVPLVLSTEQNGKERGRATHVYLLPGVKFLERYFRVNYTYSSRED
jgi:hypothetical protein